jgi:hypothetical protein
MVAARAQIEAAALNAQVIEHRIEGRTAARLALKIPEALRAGLAKLEEETVTKILAATTGAEIAAILREYNEDLINACQDQFKPFLDDAKTAAIAKATRAGTLLETVSDIEAALAPEEAQEEPSPQAS